MKILLIGDVHGYSKSHLGIAQQAPCTLQIGDLGFSYRYLDQLDPECHKFIGGNHDNYDTLKTGAVPHYLGDYGVWRGLAYIRGAFSVDRQWRIQGIDWWPEEEIEASRLPEIEVWWREFKPPVVVTHEAPHGVFHHLGIQNPLKTKTALFLQHLWEIHQPEHWYHGHHHKSVQYREGRTRFQCLNELEIVEVDSSDAL